MRKRYGAFLVAAVCAALFGCVSMRAGQGPLALVDKVDIARYLGRWYEIARFQHGFESSVVGATAEYSQRGDGRVQVVNSGFQKTLNGKYTEVKALAWVPDPSNPAALKVRFFGLFTSPPNPSFSAIRTMLRSCLELFLPWLSR